MEEQYLIEGDDSFTIVHKRSIIFDTKNQNLSLGDMVWPERAVKRKHYVGKIIGISSKRKFPKIVSLILGNSYQLISRILENNFEIIL